MNQCGLPEPPCLDPEWLMVAQGAKSEQEFAESILQ